MYVSNDARRVLASLQSFGIEVPESQLIWLELVCSYFFPNHIVKTVEKVKPKSKTSILKAIEEGWDYFDKPCYNLLTKRDGARRPNTPSIVHDGPTPSQQLWWERCQRSLLVRDMDRGEADCILWELPELDPDSERFREAVRVCKERDTRSPRYLVGILNRANQEKAGKARERDRKRAVEPQPWEPPEGYQPIPAAERARLEVEWANEGKSNTEIMKLLRDHGR